MPSPIACLADPTVEQLVRGLEMHEPRTQLARSEIAGAEIAGLRPGELNAAVHTHEDLALTRLLAGLPLGAEVLTRRTRTYELPGDPAGVGIEVEITWLPATQPGL